MNKAPTYLFQFGRSKYALSISVEIIQNEEWKMKELYTLPQRRPLFDSCHWPKCEHCSMIHNQTLFRVWNCQLTTIQNQNLNTSFWCFSIINGIAFLLDFFSRGTKMGFVQLLKMNMENFYREKRERCRSCTSWMNFVIQTF